MPPHSLSASLTTTQRGLRPATALEHVQVHVELVTGRKGGVQIEIESPSGTPSKLLTPRRDTRSGGIAWELMTVRSWGENPVGTWTLTVRGEESEANELLHWWLVLHGTTPNGTVPNLAPPPVPSPPDPSNGSPFGTSSRLSRSGEVAMIAVVVAAGIVAGVWVAVARCWRPEGPEYQGVQNDATESDEIGTHTEPTAIVGAAEVAL